MHRCAMESVLLICKVFSGRKFIFVFLHAADHFSIKLKYSLTLNGIELHNYTTVLFVSMET